MCGINFRIIRTANKSSESETIGISCRFYLFICVCKRIIHHVAHKSIKICGQQGFWFESSTAALLRLSGWKVRDAERTWERVIWNDKWVMRPRAGGPSRRLASGRLNEFWIFSSTHSNSVRVSLQAADVWQSGNGGKHTVPTTTITFNNRSKKKLLQFVKLTKNGKERDETGNFYWWCPECGSV